jgi:hypothetical protein
MRRPSEEERAYEEDCGGSPNVFDKAQSGMPHKDYRVLIMQTVARLSQNPTTKDFALAKAQVDKELARQGIGIVIPAARPSRRTV